MTVGGGLRAGRREDQELASGPARCSLPIVNQNGDGEWAAGTQGRAPGRELQPGSNGRYTQAIHGDLGRSTESGEKGPHMGL